MPLVLILLLGLLCSCTVGNTHEPGTVTIALDETPQNLDARIGIDATSERLIQLIYGSLVKRSRDFAIEPDLALSWDIPNPTTYIFHLRDDAFFHDGGKVLRAMLSSLSAVCWIGRSRRPRPAHIDWSNLSKHRTTTPWSSS